MTIVVIIVFLLLGGLLVPLSAQIESRSRADTHKTLADIRDALLGFATIYGRLPCPSTEANPASAQYGVEDASCSASVTADGFLPWKTLGVPEFDAWGAPRTAASDPRLGTWRYRVDSNFAKVFALTTGTSDSLKVFDGAGSELTTSAERAVVIVFSTGPNRQADGRNAVYDNQYEGAENRADFDDLTLWLARPILLSRMVAAGRLP